MTLTVRGCSEKRSVAPARLSRLCECGSIAANVERSRIDGNDPDAAATAAAEPGAAAPEPGAAAPGAAADAAAAGHSGPAATAAGAAAPAAEDVSRGR